MGLVGDTINLVYLHFYSLHDHFWKGRIQFIIINKGFFFFMSLTSVWYLNHSGSTLSGENWSSKVDVINRKLECSTVKHSSDGLPGENKVIKGV